jgi:predicted CXXCH cytochrome family protein
MRDWFVRMYWRKCIFVGLAAVCLIGAAALLISCSTLDRTVVIAPQIEGAMFAGNAACAECHAKYTGPFPASAHARLRSAADGMPGNGGCEACHGPGSKHIAAGGGRNRFIINPGRDATACFSCHLNVQAQFDLPQHHPVAEGKMNCAQCHDPHGLDIMKPARGFGLASQNQQCASCHRDQTRRFVFEHEALREGCATCHAPHGSINNKMLTQPDPNLCLRCHAQASGPGIRAGELIIGKVNHTRLVSRGTCWTSGCHTAVHGSNVDRTLRY